MTYYQNDWFGNFLLKGEYTHFTIHLILGHPYLRLHTLRTITQTPMPPCIGPPSTPELRFSQKCALYQSLTK